MATDLQDRREARAAWAFLAPFLILLTVFFFYAAARSLYFSFTDYDLFSPPSWVGLSNYMALLTDPLFSNALVNSLTFAFFVTVTQTILAMLLAVFVNRIAIAQGLARTVFYFPSIVSSTVMTLIFLWLFQRQGIATDLTNWFINHLPAIATFLGVLIAVQAALVWNARRKYDDVAPVDPLFLAFALIAAVLVTVAARILQVFPAGTYEEPISWLNTKDTFLFMPVTLWSIAVMNIFTTVPVLMLLYLAGLQNIPRSLYEAAEIDGATRWQMFRKITVPLLNPVTFAVVTLSDSSSES